MLVLLMAGPALPVMAETGSEDQFRMGEKYYSRGDYDKAIAAFLAAIEIAPAVSVYHHWLGKSYGRLAQQSGLLKAYNLSSKTREALEQAVALDDTNIDALEDLLEFYEQAPFFLGGGEDKASRLRERLRELVQSSGGA